MDIGGPWWTCLRAWIVDSLLIARATFVAQGVTWECASGVGKRFGGKLAWLQCAATELLLSVSQLGLELHLIGLPIGPTLVLSALWDYIFSLLALLPPYQPQQWQPHQAPLSAHQP